MDFNISINDETIVDKINITINVKEKKYFIRMKDIIDSDSNGGGERKYKTESSFINDILDKLNEPNDRFMKMDDNELIKTVSKLLDMANKLNISEYYKNIRKEMNTRDFNLRGLVSNNAIKFNSEKNRKKIRDLGRKCLEFFEIKQNEPIQPTKIDLSMNEIISISQETISQETISQPQNLNIENKKEQESLSETCIYKFKRPPKKGEICGMATIKDQPYCKKCHEHINLNRLNKHNQIYCK
jgi:hypothetical protein